MDIVTFFPPPPGPVRDATAALRALAEPVVGETPAQAQDRRNRLAELPRPWIPASCEPGLRLRLYRWLDDVATWVNDQYSWQPRTMIPPCWPRHPHIAHELAVLAMQRHFAELAIDPSAVDDWHHYHRPLFLERMQTQLNEGCRAEHTTWAGRSRMADFVGSAEDRRTSFDDDTTEA